MRQSVNKSLMPLTLGHRDNLSFLFQEVARKVRLHVPHPVYDSHVGAPIDNWTVAWLKVQHIDRDI